MVTWVPEAMPSPAAVKPVLFSSASPVFSSFMGTPSAVQKGVDCSSSQIYHPQPQIEELAFCQSLQKQQTNKDPLGSYHSQQPEPQLKPLQNEQTSIGPPRTYNSQLPQLYLRFTEPQLQLSQWPQLNMEPTWSHHAQLRQKQHPSFTERPLKIGGQPSRGILPQSISPSPLESFKSLWLFPNNPLTINQDKSAGKPVQEVRDKPRLVASISTGKNFPSTSYKRKAKETSSSAYTESFKSPMNKQLGLAFAGNLGERNTLYFPYPQLEYKHQSLPTRSDITSDKRNDDPVWNAILEVMQALQLCKLPGVSIPNPYGAADESMFDIPLFRNTESSNPSGSINHLNCEPLSNTMKDRKGKTKEVMNKKRKA